MNSNELVKYEKIGFDIAKYYSLQKKAIVERISHFKNGRLYLEIGGKFLFDSHAQRVLPGFDPTIKKKILADLSNNAEIIFCMDWEAILTDRQLKNTYESYRDTSLDYIKEIEKNLNIKPCIVINRCKHQAEHEVDTFISKLKAFGYNVYKRYFIENYPKDITTILGPNGFELDEYIPLTKNLVILTGPAANSGKLSTALGQIYLDHQHSIESGFAKYELFPIWNLPVSHPVNLAYEAATADIGDFNMNDKYHIEAYNVQAVNYNRDEEAFIILKKIAEKFVASTNFIREYKSPTDMGINMAGFCITDEELIIKCAIQEIQRRKVWYQEIVNRGDGKKNWVIQCQTLEKLALNYQVKVAL